MKYTVVYEPHQHNYHQRSHYHYHHNIISLIHDCVIDFRNTLLSVWFHEYTVIGIAQIAKILRLLSIRHRSDSFVSDRCLIDDDQKVLTVWAALG